MRVKIEGAELQSHDLRTLRHSYVLGMLIFCWCPWFDYLVDVKNLKQKLLSSDPHSSQFLFWYLEFSGRFPKNLLFFNPVLDLSNGYDLGS